MRLSRRDTLKAMLAAGATGCTRLAREEERAVHRADAPSPVLAIEPLGFPWKTLDPFLFCVHHDDRYPAGNERMGPAASLAGRAMGQDFEGRDGWRMYHGLTVPGFPQHPHRGFETVTVVRRGLLDHSDSLGAAARYGGGDVQWLTAGRGVLHAEMFPLLARDAPNPLELFQIWLNLPKANKFAEPHFAMFWSPTIPRRVFLDPRGRSVELTVIAGRLEELRPPAPPPRSWAARPESAVAIWTLDLAPGATWTIPAAPGTQRMLYFFEGEQLAVGATAAPVGHSIRLRPEVPATLENGGARAQLLLLQGRPIGEPVVQYGPFVMTSREEIRQAFEDYQRTQFGGWPWPADDHVHPRGEGRFARYADGTVERPA